jgi:hypothetical protein
VSKSSAPRRALDKAECMRRWHISRFEFVLRVIVPPDVLPDLVSLTIGRGYDTAGIYVFHKLLADFGRGLVGAVCVDYLPLFQISNWTISAAMRLMAPLTKSLERSSREVKDVTWMLLVRIVRTRSMSLGMLLRPTLRVTSL